MFFNTKNLAGFKRAFLNALFPINCCGCGKEGTWACPDCLAALRIMPLNLCPGCGRVSPAGVRHGSCRKKTDLDALVSPYHYADPFVRGLIKDYKYHGALEIEKVLKALAANGARTLATGFPKAASVVPLPLHVSRERERGFNQAERLAQAVAEALGATVVAPLVRVRKTAEQAKLAVAQRQKNCHGAFSCKNVSGDFILVDDVVTSGETMKAAATALKKAGARTVAGFALAHGHGDLLAT
jgi:ComF family protein